MSKNNKEIKMKMIKVRIRNTDLELMKKFVEITDKMGLYSSSSPYLNERTDEEKVLNEMRSFCNDVSWFNRDKNPYEDDNMLKPITNK